MNTLSNAHAPAHGHAAPSGAAAARAAGKGGAHAPAQGAGAEPGDAFADLMQSLAQQDVPDDGARQASTDEAEAPDGSTAPASAAPGLVAADPALASALSTVLAAALGTEGADATGAPAGDGAASLSATADGATTMATAKGRGPDGRGLAWAQPGDGQPPAFAAAARAGTGDARPPGLARLATGSAGFGAGSQSLSAAAALQLPGTHAAADAALASPLGALAALADDAASPVAGAAGTPARGASPAGLSSFDLSALAGPSGLDAGAPAPVHQAELRAGPQDAAFAGELAAQVDVMVQGDLQQAELRLNPVDLGPIRIELRIEGNTADVVFSAVHDATREGITRSLEQLRDMLASQGLNLGQTEVGARHAGQGNQDGSQAAHSGPTGRAARTGSGSGEDAAAAMSATARPRALRGMLDLYA